MDANTERHHVQRAVRIITQFIQNERAMREKVFKHYPTRRTAKVAECD